MSHDHSTVPPSAAALRIKAIETLLEEKGVLIQGAVDEIIDIAENRIGPRLGATVVARAWTDPDYRQRLLTDALDPVGELVDLTGANVVALENTPTVHNVVVCTLCSCYPFRLLGMSPSWYKSNAYRSRVVREPRAVLAEFGLHLPDTVEVRVWDSNAELRYFVLPMRPDGTDGWDETRLSGLVTRNAMIGTALASPADAP
jgi:nitrile hydratase